VGIHTSPGPTTCAGHEASYGHEKQDAETFAHWGIDFVKYDWCSADKVYQPSQMQAVYRKMSDDLKATGRPILFSLCQYGMQDVWKWGQFVGGQMWRTTGDIGDNYNSMVLHALNENGLERYAGPGHWNDPDMLEIGNGHMTDDEYRTHMSLWALTAAPLLAGNDIRNMTDATKAILMNKEVIAVDQDSLGKQASPVKNGDFETWVKPLADGSIAVGVVNLGASAATATVRTSDLQLRGKVKGARDLWAHQDVKFSGDGYSAPVPSHGVLLLRVSSR
jgi:alpha-galactosidase